MFVDPLGLDGEANPLHPGEDESSFWNSLSDFLSGLDLGGFAGDTYIPNVTPVTEPDEINTIVYDYIKGEINDRYIIYQQFGNPTYNNETQQFNNKTYDLDGNEVSDLDIYLTAGLMMLPVPTPSVKALKRWFSKKYLKFLWNNSGELIEAGTNIANKEAINDLVKFTNRYYGGNVTVMKNGKEVFRVHQPGDHTFNDASITLYKTNTNPMGKEFHQEVGRAKLFDKESLEKFRKALLQEDGYSLRTKSMGGN